MVKNTPLTYIAWITTDHAMFKRTCNRLYHDKDARRNLREEQMTWGLLVTDGAIVNTFL